jgi:hypothetical protein
MKRIVKSSALGTVAVGVISAAIILSLWLAGSGDQGARAAGGEGDDPTIVGLDMNPYNGSGNGTSVPRFNMDDPIACGVNGCADCDANTDGDCTEAGEPALCLNDADDDADGVVNDGCGLGPIDACIRVDHATNPNFRFDIFLDDVPTGKDFGGYGYKLSYDSAWVKAKATGWYDPNFLILSLSGSPTACRRMSPTTSYGTATTTPSMGSSPSTRPAPR